MQWVAQSAKDIVAGTLGQRLCDAVERFLADLTEVHHIETDSNASVDNEFNRMIAGPPPGKVDGMSLLIPKSEIVAPLIFVIRGEKVLLDADIAALYGVEARALNQAVARNRARFPVDFMFQLTSEEAESIRAQFMADPKVRSCNSSQSVMSSRKHRGRAYRPYAFTEQGVAMLSSVLRSPRAVEVNIA